LSAAGVKILAVTAEDVVKPYWITFTMDGRVFAFLVAVSVLTAVLFGLVPALHATRSLTGAHFAGGRQVGADRRSRRWTAALVVLELAFTVVLLTGASLMTLSVLALKRADDVIDTSGVVAMRLNLPTEKYSTPEARRSFYDRLEERLGAGGGATTSALATAVPFVPQDRRGCC
jgi:putative ABC transport system permease protein